MLSPRPQPTSSKSKPDYRRPPTSARAWRQQPSAALRCSPVAKARCRDDLLIPPDAHLTGDPFESRQLVRADEAQPGYHLSRARRVAHRIGAHDLARVGDPLDARRDVHGLAEVVEALVQVHRDARAGV